MTSGTPLRLLTLAVFVGGGVVGPVAHLAWHRPGHSHGPDGGTVLHPHSHPRPHEGQGDDDHHHHHEGTLTEPLEVPHGHGSLAHFGLALLSAPPPLELPAPAPAGVALPEERTQPSALHHPRFPRPRPPPRLVAC